MKGAQNRARQRRCLVPSPICREGNQDGAESTSPRTSEHQGAVWTPTPVRKPQGRVIWEMSMESCAGGSTLGQSSVETQLWVVLNHRLSLGRSCCLFLAHVLITELWRQPTPLSDGHQAHSWDVRKLAPHYRYKINGGSPSLLARLPWFPLAPAHSKLPSTFLSGAACSSQEITIHPQRD